MNVHLQVPFVSNTEADDHCLQACLLMILRYFGDATATTDEIDRDCGIVSGHWLWRTRAVVYLAQKGFSTTLIDSFDYKVFANSGLPFLKKVWSEEVLESQLRHCDMKAEMSFASQLFVNTTVKHIMRSATLSDVTDSLSQGVPVIVSLNPYILDRESGYAGHAVVVIGYNNNAIIYHDPGIPARKSHVISMTIFERAMLYPSARDGRIIIAQGL